MDNYKLKNIGEMCVFFTRIGSAFGASSGIYYSYFNNYEYLCIKGLNKESLKYVARNSVLIPMKGTFIGGMSGFILAFGSLPVIYISNDI